ncbi:MAG: DUF1846 domain-containing protein [Lentisphaeria bacterium]|nr:DUF1846 domain-containing protein [Lentisphaeria bacterium]
MKVIGFDNEKYLEEQSRAILERAEQFDNKLYLEFGGKLSFDCHAARVLPGYDPNVKIRLLQKLRDRIDIVICVYSGDIERKKIRSDFGISYDADTLRIIDGLRELQLNVAAVVVTRYTGQPAVRSFVDKLTRLGIKVYTHRPIQGYPTDLDTIVSDEGYGANPYIETTRPVVIMTGPGPNSGKMATCLSQVYHEQQRGIRAGYAKFETFPVWNLPLHHPVNLAYEAATADIADVNMVDPFHLEATGQTAVNYNRDVEIFPVVRRIMARIMSPERLYHSPTDMGVNRVGFCITDDAVVRAAAGQEVIRRYFRYQCDYMQGAVDREAVERVKLMMDELGLADTDRAVVPAARAAAEQAAARATASGNPLPVFCGAAIELADGRIVTGKNSPLMHAAASCILNAVKVLAGLPDELQLISSDVINSVAMLRKNFLKSSRLSLDLGEALIALSVSLPSNPAAKLALSKLSALSDCEMHLSHLPTPGDAAGLRKLGINLTSEPRIAGSNLFVD